MPVEGVFPKISPPSINNGEEGIPDDEEDANEGGMDDAAGEEEVGMDDGRGGPSDPKGGGEVDDSVGNAGTSSNSYIYPPAPVAFGEANSTSNAEHASGFPSDPNRRECNNLTLLGSNVLLIILSGSGGISSLNSVGRPMTA